MISWTVFIFCVSFHVVLITSDIAEARFGWSHRLRSNVPINVLNLDRDTGRWASVVKSLTASGVPRRQISRFPAVYGKALSEDELTENTTTLARLFCTAGMIGCFLSHRNFWIKVLVEKAPYQMILEDDVIVDSGFLEKAKECLNELEQCAETKGTWDVLLLGAFSCVHPERKYRIYRVQALLLGDGRHNPRFLTQHCHIPHRPLGTHAYILSKRGAAKLLTRAYKANFHVDCVAWSDNDLNLFLCHPMLAHQDHNVPSTVGGVTKGLESLLPNWKLDSYTGASLGWAMNEPVFRIGPFVITIGRFVAMNGASLIAAFYYRERLPRWFLPALFLFFNAFAKLAVTVLMRTVGMKEGELARIIRR